MTEQQIEAFLFIWPLFKKYFLLIGIFLIYIFLGYLFYLGEDMDHYILVDGVLWNKANSYKEDVVYIYSFILIWFLIFITFSLIFFYFFVSILLFPFVAILNGFMLKIFYSIYMAKDIYFKFELELLVYRKILDAEKQHLFLQIQKEVSVDKPYLEKYNYADLDEDTTHLSKRDLFDGQARRFFEGKTEIITQQSNDPALQGGDFLIRSVKEGLIKLNPWGSSEIVSNNNTIGPQAQSYAEVLDILKSITDFVMLHFQGDWFSFIIFLFITWHFLPSLLQFLFKSPFSLFNLLKKKNRKD